MKSSDVYDRYNELCKLDKFICNKSELDEFLLCGLIIGSKGNYILRNTDKKDIIVLEDTNYNFNINLSNFINIDLKEYGTNKIYYMSKSTYDKYLSNNLIINKDGNDYYRLYANELWLIKFI